MLLKHYCAVLLCGVASASFAQPMCTPPPPPKDGDPAEICYDKGACDMKCLPLPAPPPPPSVSCYPDGQGYSCQVYPRAPGVTYTWTSSSMWFADPGPTASPTQWLACTTPGPHYGMYELTVTSPYGASSSSGSVYVYCDASGGTVPP